MENIGRCAALGSVEQTCCQSVVSFVIGLTEPFEIT